MVPNILTRALIHLLRICDKYRNSGRLGSGKERKRRGRVYIGGKNQLSFVNSKVCT